jgi:hypothetical protein
MSYLISIAGPTRCTFFFSVLRINSLCMFQTDDYELDGLGIESWWGREFLHLSRPALRPTQPPIQWVQGLSLGVKRPGRDADHPPPPSAKGENEYSDTSTPPLGPGWPLPTCFEHYLLIITIRIFLCVLCLTGCYPGSSCCIYGAS